MGSCLEKTSSIHSPTLSLYPLREEFNQLDNQMQQLSAHQILVDKQLWGGVGPIVETTYEEMAKEIVYIDC